MRSLQKDKWHTERFALTRSIALIGALMLLVFSLCFYACSKEKIDAPTAIKEVVADLKSKNPGCMCEPYMNEYIWKNQTVYVLAYGGPGCDWFPTYYTENGTKITMTAGYTFDSFLQESQFVKRIWTCKN